MAKAIYSTSPANIPRFLAVIQSAGEPSKVDGTYLKSVGFKSGNDAYLPPILKALGFLDSAGVPTERWRVYRNKQKAKGVMAAALLEAYPELFKTYPDACRRDNEALRNFFSTHSSGLAERTLQLVVRTFKTLCEHADFDAPEVEQEILERPLAKEGRQAPPADRYHEQQGPITVNINIQLQLPATDDASIYEKLFEALNKTILARGRTD